MSITRRLSLLAGGLWLLAAAAGCTMSPAGPTSLGFPNSEHHCKAKRVVPCDITQGYRPTCWHPWEDGAMAVRACDLEMDFPPAPGAVPEPAPTVLPAPSSPPAEVIPSPRGADNRQPGNVPPPSGADNRQPAMPPGADIRQPGNIPPPPGADIRQPGNIPPPPGAEFRQPGNIPSPSSQRLIFPGRTAPGIRLSSPFEDEREPMGEPATRVRFLP
jgi:hypothetical protein